ncbi:LOW QUALITY PROTEIN: PCFT-like protein, partial [Mya arenaria]
MDEVVNKKEKGQLAGGRVLSWRRFLVGPVMMLYMTGYMISFYTVIEYTDAYWSHRKHKEAKLADNVTSSENKCKVNASDPAYKVEDEATSSASEYIVYYSLAQGLPGIISNLVLGAYTDAFGRRFLLGIGITGTTVRLMLSVIIIYFDANLLYFVGAYFIEGCTGQFTTVTLACFAYMGDITDTPSKRTYGMAYVAICLTASSTIATFIAGYLIETFGTFVAIAVSAVLIVLAFITMVVLLPESYPPRKRTKSRSIKTMLKNSASFFVTNDDRNNRWKYQLLFTAHALSEFGFLVCGDAVLYDPSVLLEFQESWTVHGRSHPRGVCVRNWAGGRLSKVPTGCGTRHALNCLIRRLLPVRGVSCLRYDALYRHVGALFSALAAVDITVNLLSTASTGTIYSVTVNYVRGAVFYVLVGMEMTSFTLL